MSTRHRNGEGLVRTGLYEELACFVPVTVREVESRSPVGVDGQGSLGSKNDVVVMATLADEKDLSVRKALSLNEFSVYGDTARAIPPRPP